MGNSKSKTEKELRQKDIEERRLRQEAERKRIKEEEEKRKRMDFDKNKEYYTQIIISSFNGYISRKEYHKLKQMKEKRTKIAEEILNTEKSYVNSLKLLIEFFYKPLMYAATIKEEKMTREFKKKRVQSQQFKDKEDLRKFYSSGNYKLNSSKSSSFISENQKQNNLQQERRLTVQYNNNNNNNNNNLLYNTSISNIPGLTKEDIKAIFSQIEVITLYNENFMNELNARISQWEWTTQLGNIFLNKTDFLKVYVSYVNNYNQSIEKITKLKENSEFLQWLEKTESKPECNNQNISSFLIAPIQRIPRYVLLLEDLLKNTPPNHLDYLDLSEALNKMKDIAKLINEKKRETESFYFIVDIYNRLDPPMEPHRRYIKEGLLKEGGKKYLFFLFNDIILKTKEKDRKKLKYLGYFPLQLINIVDIHDDKVLNLKNAFQIEIMNENQQSPKSSFTLVASTLQEKQEWVKDINEQLLKVKEKTKSFSTYNHITNIN